MHRRKSPKRKDANSRLLDSMIQQQAVKPATDPASPRGAPVGARPAGSAKAARILEQHLRTAILDPDARERLVRDAMAAGGDRSAAIRKVLDDLLAEDRRFS